MAEKIRQENLQREKEEMEAMKDDIEENEQVNIIKKYSAPSWQSPTSPQICKVPF